MKKLLFLIMLTASNLHADNVIISKLCIILDVIKEGIELNNQKLTPVKSGINIFNLNLEIPRLMKDEEECISSSKINRLKIDDKEFGIVYTANKGMLAVVDFYDESYLIQKLVEPNESYEITLNLTKNVIPGLRSTIE